MAERQLLGVIEFGGYPNFTALYQRVGFQVTLVTSVRKALSQIKKTPPDVVVAEFNFQSDFRDRSSSLETLMAPLGRLPDTKVIVFYEKDNEDKFEQRFHSLFEVHAALSYPIDEQALEAALRSAVE